MFEQALKSMRTQFTQLSHDCNCVKRPSDQVGFEAIAHLFNPPLAFQLRFFYHVQRGPIP